MNVGVKASDTTREVPLCCQFTTCNLCSR